MFRSNQASLLCLLWSVHVVMSHINSTGRNPVDYRNILVSRGETVTLTCNMSKENLTQIKWTKDGFYFAYLFSVNQNKSNFTSHRLRIDPHFPLELNISDVQYEDAGLYECQATSTEYGPKTIRWNLTVSEEPEGLSLWIRLLYILPPVFLLSGCMLSVSIYRRRTRNQDSEQNQPQIQSDEGLVSQTQHRRGFRNNNSQYQGRMNSIYNL